MRRSGRKILCEPTHKYCRLPIMPSGTEIKDKKTSLRQVAVVDIEDSDVVLVSFRFATPGAKRSRLFSLLFPATLTATRKSVTRPSNGTTQCCADLTATARGICLVLRASRCRRLLPCRQSTVRLGIWCLDFSPALTGRCLRVVPALLKGLGLCERRNRLRINVLAALNYKNKNNDNNNKST